MYFVYIIESQRTGSWYIGHTNDLVESHPSGNLTASQSDIDLTRKLKEAGKFLEIQLLDHVIVTTEGYFSFADEGLI